MGKLIKDVLTLAALSAGITTATMTSGLWYWAVIFATSYAFVWSLRKNVEYGRRLERQMQDGTDV